MRRNLNGKITLERSSAKSKQPVSSQNCPHVCSLASRLFTDNIAQPLRWQEAVVRRLIEELGLSKVMFEAPHPEVR